MARVKIYAEQQIQRINHLINELEEIRTNGNLLRERPNEKAWSSIEVIRHMSIGHQAYQKNVSNALSQLKEALPAEFIVAKGVPSFLIKRFPPQEEGKIKFKMKTTKMFKPVYSDEEIGKMDLNPIIDELKNGLFELKSWVEDYRTKEAASKRFDSALGPIVRFNVAEACEFILCHNERHFQQIRNNLKTKS